MKINSASISMYSEHTASVHYESSESLHAWTGARRPEGREIAAGPSPASADTVSLSDAAKQRQAADAITQSADAAEHDPKMQMIKAVVEALTGIRIRVVSSAEITGKAADIPELSAPETSQTGRAGFGLEYDYRETYSEAEQTAFSAAGKVRTSDGREIAFELNLTMARYYQQETNVSLRLGDAKQKDPLVVNFDGEAAQLTSQRFAFDIDGDGEQDKLHLVSGGSAFLALDHNGDGRINDGSELFGARSGDGFAELAAYDADRNHWIDENDPVYGQLKLWSKEDSGADRLAELKSAGVGAIYLGRIATPFEIKSPSNESQASVRTTGIYLGESGKAGTIQQIDLSA